MNVECLAFAKANPGDWWPEREKSERRYLDHLIFDSDIGISSSTGADNKSAIISFNWSQCGTRPEDGPPASDEQKPYLSESLS